MADSVLVTGADGFIGSHLTSLLAREGFRVRALSQYNSFNSRGWLDDIDEIADVEVVSGDVRDPFCCRKITEGIDTVFHLAALIAIPYSYVAPASYVDTNVTGTLNVCQAALDHGVERLVHTSTSEVYGTAQYVPIDELHPLQPQSPYSASKIAADAIAESFHRSFGLPVVTARPFNTYGPRQSARAVIPTVISQIASGRDRLEIGDTSPTRDFNYVEDTCRGLLALAHCDQAVGSTVNIGSNAEISIGDLIGNIKDIMGSDIELLTDEKRLRPEKSEVYRLWCDNTRIRKLTGYEPQVSLKEGLRRTIEWVTRTENLAKFRPGEYQV